MKNLAILLTALLILALVVGGIGCQATRTPKPTPVVTPTVTPTITPEPLPTPTPTPEPVTRVLNITRTFSGLSITLVSATWVNSEVELQWRIENPAAQPFKASRLYNIFYPGLLATDQSGKEAEYFVPAVIRNDLGSGDWLLYKTKLIFYPESTQISIRISDVYNEGSVFVDISLEFDFPR
ncbi:MAG: hypothetical protein FJ004_04425 [Chloroflexi bacterium]|nr:hypothetical protein [Chloroflexota bacterium]MBM3176257.1 hypothetical protein [Chloroflexota bacterium]